MGNRKKSGSGFSSAKSEASPEKQIRKRPEDHSDKEQEAANLISQGRLKEAEAIYRELIEAGRASHIAYSNLAAIRGIQGDHDEVIELQKKALQLQPNHPEAHNNLGNALRLRGNLSDAIACLRKALELKPDYAEAHHNLGIALQEQGDLTAAIDSYNKATRLRPDHPEAQCNSSLLMLLTGDYKNGWEKYEWRAKKAKNASKPHALPKCDPWSDELALTDAGHLLLVTEQGLGDTLQFMRYAIALQRKGIPVSLCAQPKLHSLIQASGIDSSPLTPQQANQVSSGRWIPLLSVPRLLGVSPAKPIITNPYIKPPERLIAKWQYIFSAEDKPIIGINWQGNPETEKTELCGRSASLEAFASIACISHVSLLSLQKGFGSEQLETCLFKERFVSCQDQVNDAWDFLETAAIIANCDLVITSDTAVAHLAGGMGKTTWLLLHKVPDWRWGLEGDTTFWYPSIRLFRQREKGNWGEVMDRVAEALQEHF